MKEKLVCILLFCCAGTYVNAQKITYARPNTNDRELEEYEVIGNYNTNTLVYKKLRNLTIISVYNAEMVEQSRNNLNIAPNKIIKTDFIAYPQFSYMIYQYLTKKIVFCMAAKLDIDGKIIGKPTQLDYFEIKHESESLLYHVLPYNILTSEDKKRIMVVKAGKIAGEKFVFKTSLFDENLVPQHVGQSALPMIDSLQSISEFALGNDGKLVFINSVSPTSDKSTTRYFLQEKPALEDNISTNQINTDNLFLKNLKLRLDDINHQYLLTSFYYDSHSKDVQGICSLIWDKQLNKQTDNHITPLGDGIRDEATSNNKTKASIFNDFYLQSIILNADGSFLITAESQHIVLGNAPILPLELEAFAPIPANNQVDADGVLVLWFNKNGNLEKSNVISKSQYTFNPTAGVISYALVNSGDKLHFLYNAFGKIKAVLPTYQTLGLQQKMDLPAQLLGFDGNYLLLPGLAKQTSLHQSVIPCISQTFLTFSKVEF